VTATASDAQSGISSYAFPTAASGWSVSGSGASRTYSHSGSPTDPAEPNDVTVANGAGLGSGPSSFTVTPDASAPAGISATAGGFYAALSVAVTLDNGNDTGSGIDATSGIVERDETLLDNGDGSCDAFPGSWSTVTLSGGNDTTVQTGKCYRYRYKLSDRVGNEATSAPSGTAKVDTTAPSVPTLSFGSLQTAAVTGSTVYYRPSAASGQFAVSAGSSDGQSGVASYAFPGAAAGWSVSGSGDTRTYSHSGSPSDPAEPSDVIAVNGAGTASGAASYTVTPDGTTPSSSILCDGAACAGWHPATVSVTLSSSDTGSGLAQIRYTTDGSDPTATTGTVYSGAFDVSTTTEIRYRGFDRVGNAEAIQSETIQFDTSAPTGPTLTLSETPVDPDQHAAGTTLYYRPGGGRAGTFTVDAATSDPQSGIQKVTFPAIAGMTGGGDDLASPFEGVYDWSTGTGASGAQTVTARNNASLTSSAGFTVTPDSTAPVGQSVALGGGTYYTALSVPLTLVNGSDSDSGVSAASGLLERESATLSNDSCVGWSGVWTAVTLTGGADTSVLGDRCYRYRYTISDNVGNQTAPSALSGVAKVDVTAPVTSDDAPAGWSNAAVTVTLGVSESGSGVASTQYRVDGGPFQSGTSVVIPAPADHSNDGVHTIQYRSTDNAGNAESLRSVSVRIDTTLPTTSDDAPGGWRNSAVTVTLTPGDALSGVASTQYRIDGGAFQSGVSVGVPAPADGSNDGIHVLEYRSTDNAGNTEPLHSVNVKIDATLPTGSVTAPSEAQHVNGVVPVTAAAADGGSGVASVEFLVRPNGAGSFATISTDTTAPYQASWDSSSAAEGNAELKVVVRDAATNVLTSAVRSVVVDNPPAPTLDDPGANVGGLITLSASSAADTAQVVFERSPEGAGAWTTIATDLTAPFAASFDTTAVGDGRYDFRAVATDAGGFGGTSPLRTSRVDNTRPTVSMSDPPSGAVVGGPNVHLGALASDAGSGVASVRFEGRPAGGGAFALLGTDTSAPFDATWDTTSLAGAYELQAVATDAAGNPQTSVATLVTVDPTAPSVTLADIRALVRGVVTLSASTQSAAVSQVVFKRKPSGGDSWADLETDTAAPWSAAFDTRSVADGLYDVRAQALDSAGTVLATHTRENIRVDNTAPALVSSTPADGSTVTEATSVVVVASEAVAAVQGVTLDGGVATPEIAGAQVTFATGTLAAGEHALTGSLEDAAGNSSTFRVRFSVQAVTAPTPTALSLQLGKPRSTKRGKNQVFSIPVTLSIPARVQVTLLSPRGRRLRSTTVQLGAGRRLISLSVPRASLPPGRYTLLVTATSPSGTQVVRRAHVTIAKAAKRKAAPKPKPQTKQADPTQLTPSGGAVSDDGPGAPPPAATPIPSSDSGGRVPPRVRRSESTRERSAPPLATGTSFVGEEKQKTFGLGLVVVSMGGAIGFLIKIELHRLLGRPRRLGVS
jgi:Chitobiase/beta-hexosaminidase C-terminal domain/Bacterial Ig domain/Bacterial Ig-like domain (group 3)